MGYVMKLTGDDGQLLVPVSPTATTDASYSVEGLRSLMTSLSSAVATLRYASRRVHAYIIHWVTLAKSKGQG